MSLLALDGCASPDVSSPDGAVTSSHRNTDSSDDNIEVDGVSCCCDFGGVRLSASNDVVPFLEGSLLLLSNEGDKGATDSLPELLCTVSKVETVDELHEISTRVVVITLVRAVSVNGEGSTFSRPV